jgi:RNA polymerase sigma-70 factor (ECF subfamily)
LIAPGEEQNLTAKAFRPASTSLPQDLESIFRLHHELVYRAAYRITGNAVDAEDVLQTLFLRLLRRGTTLELTQNPKAYLHRAAVNISLDLIKMRRRHVPEQSAPEPSRSERGLEVREWVRSAMAELTPKSAEIFVLRYVEGYDNAEIARIIGTSRGTVAVLLFRARARLKKILRRQMGEQR